MPPGGDIPTPALAVELSTLDRNIQAMAGWAARSGIGLRPHAKTHKTSEIASRQLSAGASGLTVATLGEAEVFANEGFEDLFVAYPFWPGGAKGARLEALAERAHLRVGTDSAEAARAIGAAVAPGTLEVLIEVDCGNHRSGVAPGAAVEVADAAARAGLAVEGVFTFPGHSYGPGMAERAAKDEAQALEMAAECLARAGHAVQVRSGGSTPSAFHSIPSVVNELRPGIYVFNDAQQVALGTCDLKDVALWAASTVVSLPDADRLILDAGSKVLGADRAPWLDTFGLLPDWPGAKVVGLYEHHAVVATPAGASRPGLGQVVRVIPNHVCSAVNLADELYVLDGGSVVGTWRVIARGRNS